MAAGAASGPQPPVVSLLGPKSGASFSQSWEILLFADANDPDGSITKVEFYDGSRLLAVDTDGLYYTAIRPGDAALGTHILAAKAYDNDGLTATAEVTVEVRPPAIIQVSGRVVAGVEAGCRILQADASWTGSGGVSWGGSGAQYQLMGGDRGILAPGARVLVTGEIMSGVVSYCMQGSPLRVVSATLI